MVVGCCNKAPESYVIFDADEVCLIAKLRSEKAYLCGSQSIMDIRAVEYHMSRLDLHDQNEPVAATNCSAVAAMLCHETLYKAPFPRQGEKRP